MICRACADSETTCVIDRPAPGLTSLADRIDVPTRVHHCRRCGHLSSETLPEIERYYTDRYDTVSGNDDDLMGLDERGEPIHRVQRQAGALTELIDIPATGRLLDFGCGHGLLMRRFAEHRPGWQVSGYEVSERYAAADVSIGTLPPEPFELITAFYVFEHLDDPVAATRSLVSRLTPDGRLLLAVPDVATNPIDVLAVDHASHFTLGSLRSMLARNGLAIEATSTNMLPASLLIAAHRDDVAVSHDAGNEALAVALSSYWDDAETAIAEAASSPAAIYGAGVYGAFIRSTLETTTAPVTCFLDRNTRKQGRRFWGLPVLAPEAIPDDVRTVFLGVRPDAVPAVASSPALAGRALIVLPEWSALCTT